MKLRIFTMVILLLVTAGTAGAWDLRPATIETHAGVSEARFTGDSGPNTDAQRLAFDIEAGYPLVPGVALHLGAGFAGRGGDLGKQTVYVWDGYAWYVDQLDVRYDVDYLQFPALLRVTAPLGRVRPVFTAGPNFAVKTGERYWVNDRTVNHEGQAQDEFGRFDWGFLGGAGLEADTPFGTWSLEGRYTRGMLDVRRTRDVGGAIHNRDVQIVLGLRRDWRVR